jgi:hypothetical protein
MDCRTQGDNSGASETDVMLESVRHLRRFNVAAVDGTIGTIRDVLLDTSSWCIRYLFVATGRWVPCRTVLISPIEVDRIDRASQSVTLAVTHEAGSTQPAHRDASPGVARG